MKWLRARVYRELVALLLDRIADLLLLFLWVLVFVYVVRSAFLEAKDKISLSLSMTALVVSLYTARRTLDLRPDVRMASGIFPEDIHIGAQFPLVFYNSGRMPTYFCVREVHPSDSHLEVIPNQFPLQQITDRGYWHADCEIRAKEGSHVLSARTVSVTIKFVFWCGKRVKLREGQIVLMIRRA